MSREGAERKPVYLDYAATSAIRPPEVAAAVSEYLGGIGATPGRSGHARAIAAGRVALRCRRALTELFGIRGDPGRIAFQYNATHALNTALFGILQPGDRVVRTVWDHNAVRRPITALAASGVQESVISGTADGGLDLDELAATLRERSGRVKLVVIPHASNVTGAVLPVREIADLAHEAGALVLLDAAQTAGHLPIDVETLGVDLLAVTGHKGLLGPQGIGALWVREGVEVAPLLYGGTGSESAAAGMPLAMPDRLEAGSQNGPGIAGLLAGVEWLTRRGVGEMQEHEAALKRRLVGLLRAIPGVQIRSPITADGVGIVTIITRHHPAELARRLEAEHGILVRAGLHCAPGAHEALGTLGTGAVRLSIGWATTQEDIQRVVQALAILTA